MKTNLFRITTFLLILFSQYYSFSQEICDNAIDDDMDGLIDLNDPDCACSDWINSIIPNPSFEDTVCCPDFTSQMECAETWLQASDGATSDFYYQGCFEIGDVGWGWEDYNPSYPLPGGGKGYAGFIVEGTAYTEVTNVYCEYVGAELIAPLEAGTEYTLSLYLALRNGEDFELSIFGNPAADPGMPWAGDDCPMGLGEWQLLASQAVSFGDDSLIWQEEILTFTPDVDINSIAIGGPCEPGFILGTAYLYYYYLDEITLIETDRYPTISESGDWCEGTLTLEATIDTTDGEWQWYQNGIALLGENSAFLNITPYGFGPYTAVYTVGGNCKRIEYVVEATTELSTTFEWLEGCPGSITTFTNTSIVGAEITPSWEWDFGDGATSTEENPNHIYASSGEYVVTLNGINDLGCNQSKTAIISIVDFHVDFEVYDTLGCYPMHVAFTNTSESSGMLEWDFGDGSYATVENPTHDYLTNGDYDVTLSLATADGACTGLKTKNITVAIYDYPIADFSFTPSPSVVNDAVNFQDLSSAATGWYWNFGDTGNSEEQNPMHTYFTEGTYQITLIAQNGICPDTVRKTIEITKPLLFYIPNSFTPDGDEFNPTFKPIFTEGYDPYDYHLTIFNRWGELIFESYNSTIGWNGTYGDKYVTDGTYIWSITFGSRYDDEILTFNGHVSVLK